MMVVQPGVETDFNPLLKDYMLNFSFSDNEEIEELIHSIGASFILITIYTICLYIVEPLANYLLSLYGVYFANDHHTIQSTKYILVYQMILRALLAILCSGYAGYLAGLRIFPKQNRKQTILLSLVFAILVPVMSLGIVIDDKLKQMGSNNFSIGINQEGNFSKTLL